MKKFFIIVTALVGMTIVDVSTAQAFGGRRRGQVTYVPAPSPVVAQGQVNSGYRSYSYQPTTEYRTDSYQPGPTYYPSPSRSQPGGFHDAGWKIRGF